MRLVKPVSIHEAKTHFSRLVARAEAGEEIIVCRGEKPVAKLVGYSEPLQPRVPGAMKGEIWMAPDFDEIPPGFEDHVG